MSDVVVMGKAYHELAAGNIAAIHTREDVGQHPAASHGSITTRPGSPLPRRVRKNEEGELFGPLYSSEVPAHRSRAHATRVCDRTGYLAGIGYSIAYLVQ